MKARNGSTVDKANLPEKACATCGRPFRWRKKWAKIWSDVRYCSERCRRTKRSGPAINPAADQT
ncbi:MAG: DUF2256 domain-containing protein [Pseudomonadota bacterium]